MTKTLTIILVVMAGVAWGERDGIIHLECRPLNPVVGQDYTFGNDPNTHTYMGGNCWSSTLIHWTKVRVEPVKVKKVKQPRTNEMKAVSLSLMTDGNAPYIADKIYVSKEGIQQIATDGQICAVFGHWAEDVQVIRYGFTINEKRRCRLCGKRETKTIEWK